VRRRLLLTTLLLFAWAVPAHAEFRLIVRVTSLPILQTACRLIGCNVVRGLDDPLSQLFLINAPNQISPLFFLLKLTSQIGIKSVELDLPVNVINPLLPFYGGVHAPPGLNDRRPVSFYGSTVWNGYANQPAARMIKLQEAQTAFGASGGPIVAVIDTGIDHLHPALRNVVMPGYDFTRDQPGYASESADVNQSTVAVVDGGAYKVNQSTVAVVDQSTVAVVDDPKHAAFGHGTMVAGVVHLAAPGATIMPLKAFRSDGSGYLSDIVRAVYWAVRSNARVINMSFSTSQRSSELNAAIEYATSRQVVCVASAGNTGRRTMVYPAGLSSVMGIASTNYQDRRSSFSNYGERLVWAAAPGEGIIAPYPNGTYAATWGTSFSTPFVSGTAALLLNLQPGLSHKDAANAIAKAKPVGRELGNGRLDVYRALQSVAH
jgi:subtilisin family serine protease